MSHLPRCVLWFSGFLLCVSAGSAATFGALTAAGFFVVSLICAGNAYFAARAYIRGAR